MGTLVMNYPKFDVVEYIRKLRNVGVSQEIAEVQGQELEHIINDILCQTKHNVKEVLNSNEFATKSDIESVRKEIAQTSNKTIIWIGGLLFASGLIQHFFK